MKKDYKKIINKITVDRGQQILEEIDKTIEEIDKLVDLSNQIDTFKNQESKQAIANYITLRLATIFEVFRFAVIAKIIKKYEIKFSNLFKNDLIIKSDALSYIFDKNTTNADIVAYSIGTSKNDTWDEPFHKLLNIEYVVNNYFFQVIENALSEKNLRHKIEIIMIDRNKIIHQMENAKIGEISRDDLIKFRTILLSTVVVLMIGMEIKIKSKKGEDHEMLKERCMQLEIDYEKVNSDLEQLLNYDSKDKERLKNDQSKKEG